MNHEIIIDKRRLKALIRRGLIKEAKHAFLPWIDLDDSFEYNGYKYMAHHVDGSFYPVLKRIKLKNRLTSHKKPV